MLVEEFGDFIDHDFGLTLVGLILDFINELAIFRKANCERGIGAIQK